MTDQLSLSLRAGLIEKQEENLPDLIKRINHQRGSFRNITEQSLQEEIQANPRGETQGEEQTAADDATSTKTPREEILAARDEILKQVAQAYTESMYALDFVSMILSRYSPRQAEISTSPFLKQHIPLGSIGAEVVQTPQVTDVKKEDDNLVCVGWKLQALTKSADALFQSAARLKQEMEEEARYWKQLVAIKNKGWAVCRMPRERHTLGVRFGFVEAAPAYRDRGFAALRRRDGGNVSLDPGFQRTPHRVLRIRVQRSGQVIASSVDVDRIPADDGTIENQLLRARKSIFDEELFHEALREARQLTNRGVKCIRNAISLPTDDATRLLMDLSSEADYTTHPEPAEAPETTLRLGQFSSAIAVLLRLLLSHAHRQNYKRRTEKPPPLTDKKPVRQLYHLLQPILNLLHQQSAVSSFHQFAHRLQITLAHAQLPFVIDHPPNALDFNHVISAAKSANAVQEVLIGSIAKGLQSTTVLQLPSTLVTVSVLVRTHAQGTDYRITVSAPSAHPLARVPPDVAFTTAAEMQDHVLHVVGMDVVDAMASTHRGLKLVSLHTGEFYRVDGTGGRNRLVVLALGRDGLRLDVGGSGDDAGQGAFVWKGGEGGERRGVGDVLDSIR